MYNVHIVIDQAKRLGTLLDLHILMWYKHAGDHQKF